MNSVQDAIYNWLTIKIVIDARPEDTAAVETEKMFYDILLEKHMLSNIEVSKDEDMYYVHFDEQGERKKQRFPRELIEIMLNQINQQPEKYRNYPQ
ncbi:hypothetical protein J27TS8_13700 [Robertmurraya siralis]|uniref:Uncharacterized protein n=1 Tax=Robertmurraya siralis TaxID=77777 RepID=A0A919WGL0_9BACI|nr:hypothetical protein [Robertmurraya siralis]PAE19269.1 hypothetical protein CHH80_17875 [Bacillus sp. 7504-2]GIN61377.1 hypothetical protein J27TS8_13700 [Robertmurraya siralis]